MDLGRTHKLLGIVSAVVLFLAAAFFVTFYWSQLSALVFERYFAQQGGLRSHIPEIIDSAVLILETIIFLAITSPIFQWYLERRGKKSQARLIISFYTYIVWAIVIILLLSTFFKDFGTILTSLGLIGFGITFALQKPILNFVGWLTIVVTNPFSLGERIEVNGIRGDVISVHTMYTRVQGIRPTAQTKNEQLITIPNELILTNPVLNYSRVGHLFSDDLSFLVTYESNWKKAVQILERAATEQVAKFVKTQMPITFAEKRAWEEAMGLLREASGKIKRGFLRSAMTEQIEIMKGAKTQEAPPLPKPRMQVLPAESGININVLYQTDLHSVRDTKNAISQAFLEEIAKQKDIEIAYPHVKLVREEKKKSKK